MLTTSELSNTVNKRPLPIRWKSGLLPHLINPQLQAVADFVFIKAPPASLFDIPIYGFGVLCLQNRIKRYMVILIQYYFRIIFWLLFGHKAIFTYH
jgi:hypothetical protein